MKKINIVLFGVGNVGSTLINQVLELKPRLLETEEIELNVPVILNSRTAFFAKESVASGWESDFKKFGFPYKFQNVLDYVREQKFENLTAIDATASRELVQNYSKLVKAGFHIVAANKVANTLSSEFYYELRQVLRQHSKQFLYETNVGAGLPVIQTIRDLHASGERITKIRGVFSGSLSYIFNTFSSEEIAFDEVVNKAGRKGYTEPDPRIDLSGKDVGRKLLILARELQLKKELSDVNIQDLVPKHLNGSSSLENFRKNQKDINPELHKLKSQLSQDEVLRHIGELDVSRGNLEVKLVNEKKTTPFGSLQQADASFEIYTESYGERPIVIQGAGAGAAVTARGVLGDILKLTEKLN